MSVHTPGPWYVAELCANRIKVESHQDGYVAEVWRYGADGDANARLISAAPELLEALKGLLSHLESWKILETADGDIARTRAAIAKAEGRQP